jgi:hypothetical protein
MTFTLGLPQIIWILLVVLMLCHDGVKHGQPKEGKENIWITLTAQIISLGILYWGGFFG